MHKPQATLRTGRHMPRSTRRGPGPPRARSAATPLKTTESRVTALGDAIREHPAHSPARDTQRHWHRRRHARSRHRPLLPTPSPRDHRTMGSSPHRCHDGVAACRASSTGGSAPAWGSCAMSACLPVCPRHNLDDRINLVEKTSLRHGGSSRFFMGVRVGSAGGWKLRAGRVGERAYSAVMHSGARWPK
jgi:hypothetical protein